jgi:zinc transporter ZupT
VSATTPVLIGLGSSVATALGGLVAMRVRDHRHLVLGAAGGVLPEALRESHLTIRGIPVTMRMFVLGAVAGSLIPVPAGAVALYLAYFAGFLMHIATGTILPEAHADHPSWGTLAATVLGVLFMGGVIAVLG